MKFLILNTVNLIVLNFDNLNSKKLQLARDLRTLGNSSAVVMLAPQVDLPLIKRMEKVYKSVLIQKPVKKNDLIGVIRKYLADQIVPQRLHERFHTDTKSSVEAFGSAARTNSKMLNISKTGAYLECPETPKFSVGDLVRVDVELEELKKIRSVHAKVVWVCPLNTQSSLYGAGVHFIPDNQIYKYMLNMV